MANSYLTFTQAAGTSRKKFTYSVWMKRSTDNTSGSYNSGFFNCWSDANNRLAAYFYDNKLYLYGLSGGSANISVRTNRLFRDLSAWYHIVIAVDTTQSTAADRIKFYVNGVQETSLDQTTYPAQDHDLPSVGVNAKAIEVGRVNFGDQSTYYYMDGYLSHVAFVDGTALTPSSFGETDSTSGIWKFKSPSGVTWGTNGFHLKFENSGALGTDSSGNSNTFTVNGNLKQALDTPSNTYATLSPLSNSSGTFSNGNNSISGGNDTASTLGVSAGKWYWEVKRTNTTTVFHTGICSSNKGFNGTSEQFLNGSSNSVGASIFVRNDGSAGTATQSSNAGFSSVSYNLNSFTVGNGDILGFALDLESATKRLDIYKNGSSVGYVTFSYDELNPIFAFSRMNTGATSDWNYGNGYFGTTAITSAGSNGNGSLFEYDVPSGYYALNTKNINTYG